jgi:hypothetical protein
MKCPGNHFNQHGISLCVQQAGKTGTFLFKLCSNLNSEICAHELFMCYGWHDLTEEGPTPMPECTLAISMCV